MADKVLIWDGQGRAESYSAKAAVQVSEFKAQIGGCSCAETL